MNDVEVVQRVLAGDESAYAELVRAYQAKVRGLCFGFLKDLSQADDAAQDAFIKAYKNLPSFKGQSSFGTWLFRIAVNHCKDVLRQRNRARSESLDAILENSREESTGLHRDFPHESLENQDLLKKILASVSEENRTALVLREIQGFSYQEIAETMGVSLDAVRARLQRARQELIDLYRHFTDLQNV